MSRAASLVFASTPANRSLSCETVSMVWSAARWIARILFRRLGFVAIGATAVLMKSWDETEVVPPRDSILSVSIASRRSRAIVESVYAWIPTCSRPDSEVPATRVFDHLVALILDAQFVLLALD